MGEAFGTASLRSWSCLATSSGPTSERPVTFPPGRAMLATRAHGIAARGEHDGNGRGGVLGREGGRGSRRHDHVHLEGHELGGERGKALHLALRPPILDRDGSSLRVTAVTQFLPKGIEAWVRVRRAAGTEKPDAEYLGRLLRVARGKDAETAEEQGDSENKSRCRHGLPSWLGSVTRQHTACSSAEVADGPGPLGLCP